VIIRRARGNGDSWLATIAAAIGAGGLGEYIFRGLAMVNNQLILRRIPAAALALLADVTWGGWKAPESELDRTLVKRDLPPSPITDGRNLSVLLISTLFRSPAVLARDRVASAQRTHRASRPREILPSNWRRKQAFTSNVASIWRDPSSASSDFSLTHHIYPEYTAPLTRS